MQDLVVAGPERPSIELELGRRGAQSGRQASAIGSP